MQAEKTIMLGVWDPLILFKMQNMESSCYGDKTLPNTWYGMSENGTLW